MNYFESDTRWELLGIKDNDSFISKMVIKGHFHNRVPDDIQGAWETVEYLLAHAYYHWQMYDEGLKKSLLIIEMAVKQKADKQQVCLEKTLKNGKKKNKDLNDVIEEVFQGNHYCSLKEEIHLLRRLRNKQMHPDSNFFMGGMGSWKDYIKQIHTIINKIFLPDNWHKEGFVYETKIKDILTSQKDAFVYISYDDKKIIPVDRLLGYRVLEESLVFSFTQFHIENSNKASFTKPFLITINNIRITDNIIEGVKSDGNSIQLCWTNKDNNISNIHKSIRKCFTKQSELIDLNIQLQFVANKSLSKLIEEDYKYFIEYSNKDTLKKKV